MEIEKVKEGKKVEFTRRNGEVAKGFICGEVVTKTNGAWVDVNTGTKREPDVTTARVTQLRPQTR